MKEKVSLNLINKLDSECVERAEEIWRDMVEGFWVVVKQRMYPGQCDYSQYCELAQEFKSSLTLRDSGERIRQELLEMIRERLLEDFADFVDARKEATNGK